MKPVCNFQFAMSSRPQHAHNGSSMKNFILPLLALVLVAGCGVKKPIQPRQDPYLPAQIHMIGPGAEDLRRMTAVDAPRMARDEEGGLLHVTVPIRSASNYDLHVDCFVTFLDRNGMVVGKFNLGTKTIRAN